MSDENDPCPGAAKLSGLPAWQHPYAVRCQFEVSPGVEHGYALRFAWFINGRHLCGLHRHGPGEDDA